MLDPIKTIQILQKQPDCHPYKSGEAIFEVGQTATMMYGIIEGEVDIIVNGKVVETLHPSDVFGEGAIIHPDHKRHSTAVAKLDCKLACMDLHHFLFAVEETPQFAIQIMYSYSERLRQLREKL